MRPRKGKRFISETVEEENTVFHLKAASTTLQFGVRSDRLVKLDDNQA